MSGGSGARKAGRGEESFSVRENGLPVLSPKCASGYCKAVTSFLAKAGAMAWHSLRALARGICRQKDLHGYNCFCDLTKTPYSNIFLLVVDILSRLSLIEQLLARQRTGSLLVGNLRFKATPPPFATPHTLCGSALKRPARHEYKRAILVP